MKKVDTLIWKPEMKVSMDTDLLQKAIEQTQFGIYYNRAVK